MLDTCSICGLPFVDAMRRVAVSSGPVSLRSARDRASRDVVRGVQAPSDAIPLKRIGVSLAALGFLAVVAGSLRRAFAMTRFDRGGLRWVSGVSIPGLAARAPFVGSTCPFGFRKRLGRCGASGSEQARPMLVPEPCFGSLNSTFSRE